MAIKNGSTTLASYSYDGLNRLIQVTEGGTTTDLYVSASDQVLAEYQGSTVTAYNVWSPVYVNALVFRALNQGSWQRFYALQDANWNVTALVNGTGGVVVERYAYDPYGAITVMSSAWVVQNGSNYDVPNMWQGMRYDWTTNLYVTPSGRFVSPTLMRPLQPDPLGQEPDVNPYRWQGDNPTDAVDPSGLDEFWIFEPRQALANIWDALTMESPVEAAAERNIQAAADRLFKNDQWFYSNNLDPNVSMRMEAIRQASIKLYPGHYKYGDPKVLRSYNPPPPDMNDTWGPEGSAEQILMSLSGLTGVPGVGPRAFAPK